MKTKYNRVWAEINLDAVRSNMEQMKQNMAEGAAMAGVVKADGYGHGAVPIAKTIAPYVCMYAVATVEEGIILRRHGIEKPILILGVVHENQYAKAVSHDLDLAMFELSRARLLSEEAGRQHKTAGIHFAVDTGMSRIGFSVTEEAAEEARAIAALSGIRIDGMFTHFARADEEKKDAAEKQYQKFLQFCDMVRAQGVQIPLLHCSNSAAILELQHMHMNMARAGISIYGMYPSDEMKHEPVHLTPVMELHSEISYVKTIEAGDSVSYGGTFTASERMRVATIPVGYADGYPRGASGKADVLIHGKRARILGRVCMDQFMVDVTHIPEAEEGDEVILVGRDQTSGEGISMEELAARSGGFHYELCCDIGKRVPRVYLKGGAIVGNKDYFEDSYMDFL